MKHDKYRQFCNILLCGVSTLVIISCETTVEPEVVNNNLSSSQVLNETTEPVEASSVNMNQIPSVDATLNTRQIAANTDTNKLTVNQLRIYADRCSPNASLSPPKGLDCSELNLRVKRLFRSEDKVTEALITLDRLGRNDTIDNALEDLEDGHPGNSLNSQAIAGGLLDPTPPAPPDPEENLEDFLNQNGLAINAGAIIANPQ